MARTVSTEKFLNTVAERTIDNTRLLKRDINQRRNGMEDLYGVVFSEYGDKNNPAKFYISISPNYGYLERFAFKLVIKPYVTTVTGGTDSQIVQVEDTRLNISNNAITPNPHTHDTKPHTHNLISGISLINTTSDNFKMKIAGVDITPYLIEQHDGDWIDGEGIYPNNRLEDVIDFYDILDVASVLTAEGNDTDREKLLEPDFKEVAIESDAPFGVEAYLYLKYSHVNR